MGNDKDDNQVHDHIRRTENIDTPTETVPPFRQKCEPVKTFDPTHFGFVDINYSYETLEFFEYNWGDFVDGIMDPNRLTLYLTQDGSFVTVWHGMVDSYVTEYSFRDIMGDKFPDGIDFGNSYDTPLFQGHIDGPEQAGTILRALRLSNHRPSHLHVDDKHGLCCDSLPIDTDRITEMMPWEAARYLEMSNETFDRLLKEGKILNFGTASSPVIRKEDLDAFNEGRIVLSPDDWDAFVDALENPPPLNEKLFETFKDYQKRVANAPAKDVTFDPTEFGFGPVTHGMADGLHFEYGRNKAHGEKPDIHRIAVYLSQDGDKIVIWHGLLDAFYIGFDLNYSHLVRQGRLPKTEILFQGRIENTAHANAVMRGIRPETYVPAILRIDDEGNPYSDLAFETKPLAPVATKTAPQNPENPDLSEIHENWKNDPAYMAEYDALGPAFNIVDQLISARSQAGVTQQDIADNMGLSLSDVVDIEDADKTKSLTVEVLRGYANATGTELTIALVPPTGKTETGK